LASLYGEHCALSPPYKEVAELWGISCCKDSANLVLACTPAGEQSSRGTHLLCTSSTTWPLGHSHSLGISHTIASQMTNGLVHVAGQGDAHLTGTAPSMSHGFPVAGSEMVVASVLTVGCSVSSGCLVSGSTVVELHTGQHWPKGVTVETPFSHSGGAHPARSHSGWSKIIN